MKYILVLLLAQGCAPYLSEDGGRCPCKEGWKCCNAECVLEQIVCNPDGGGGEEVIIASRTSIYGTGGSPAEDQVAIYLLYGFSDVECMGGVGYETPHSGPGTTVYDASNDNLFNDLVACITNGEDDYVREGIMFYPNGNGSEGTYNESEFWNEDPDLAGCTITEIRHVISSLNISPDGQGGADVDGEWVWEVWGDCGGGD